MGDTHAGPEMHFSFFDLVQHLCKTRRFTAGTILGSGTVGGNACEIAMGMGAAVTVLGRNVHKLAAMEAIHGNRISTLSSNQNNIEAELGIADLVVGAVLVPGANERPVGGRPG